MKVDFHFFTRLDFRFQFGFFKKKINSFSELMVTQVPLIEWKEEVKADRERQCFDFLFERFKMYYMPHIFPEFNWHMSLYRPSLELPEVRHFRPAFVDNGDGTKKMDPMLACR